MSLMLCFSAVGLRHLFTGSNATCALPQSPFVCECCTVVELCCARSTWVRINVIFICVQCARMFAPWPFSQKAVQFVSFLFIVSSTLKSSIWLLFLCFLLQLSFKMPTSVALLCTLSQIIMNTIFRQKQQLKELYNFEGYKHVRLHTSLPYQ